MALKHFIANAAVKCLQVGMIAKQMFFQSIWPIESAATDMARIVTNIHVAFKMHLQISRTGESCRALVTFVLLHTIVCSKMLGQL